MEKKTEQTVKQPHKHTFSRLRLFSVKSRVAALMLLCWFLPLVLLAGLNAHYLSGDRLAEHISKEVDRLKFTDETVIDQLGRVVEASRKASYDGTLTGLYRQYRRDEISARELISGSSQYLQQHYIPNENIKMAVLWYWKNPEMLDASAYDTGRGVTYANLLDYWKKDHYDVHLRAQSLNTKYSFLLKENRLYLIRNLYTADYERAATLVLLVDQEACFRGYSTFPEGTSVTLKLDENVLQVCGSEVTAEETGLKEMGGASGYTWKSGVLSLYHERRLEGHDYRALVRIEDPMASTALHGVWALLLGMVLFLIPLMAVLMILFHRHVTKPIRDMMAGAEEIEAGHFGYQLTQKPETREFRYLTDAFNSMSHKLDYQFHHIYEEELALRDARIKALQSHINPHFMNNTLEIINWEARLSGNEKVSRMIESLAVLMNAGIDRNRIPEIPLSEEMVYVNAYLYIISQRLGDRLTILNELPEEIMGCRVPRLILQPVIENAIEHGVVRSGQGSVLLYGYRKGEYLYLEIMNESTLTPEDEARIARLLDPEYDPSRESSASIGIANVNQRLRILYGEGSGLSVQRSDSRHVTSRLTIHLREEDREDFGKRTKSDK